MAARLMGHRSRQVNCCNYMERSQREGHPHPLPRLAPGAFPGNYCTLYNSLLAQINCSALEETGGCACRLFPHCSELCQLLHTGFRDLANPFKPFQDQWCCHFTPLKSQIWDSGLSLVTQGDDAATRGGAESTRTGLWQAAELSGALGCAEGEQQMELSDYSHAAFISGSTAANGAD